MSFALPWSPTMEPTFPMAAHFFVQHRIRAIPTKPALAWFHWVHVQPNKLDLNLNVQFPWISSTDAAVPQDRKASTYHYFRKIWPYLSFWGFQRLIRSRISREKHLGLPAKLVISWSSNISSWILSAYLRWFIYWCLFRYWYVVPPSCKLV